MQRLVEAAIVVLVVAAIVSLAARRSAFWRRHVVAGRLLVGLAVGLLAGFVVLVPEADLVPDEFEGVVEPIFVIAVTTVAVVGSAYRLARR